MKISEFLELPIMGIIRDIRIKSIPNLLKVIIDSGLKTVEVAMNSLNAPRLIKKTIECSEGKLTVGAGTVTNLAKLNSALQAGASFIVSPVLDEDIAVLCKEGNIPYFPGALTPNEVFRAWKYGASMVKIFPAKMFGPTYFKELKAPLNKISMLACGGVNPENVSDYIRSGATAVAFGSSIFKKEWIDNGEFDQIRGAIKALIKAYNICIR